MGDTAAGGARGARPVLRVLVVCPSWVGDAVMATPTLTRVRRAMPGAFLGALARPGIDQVLAGGGWFDDWHVDRASGVMGVKRVAQRLRPLRYDAALLLTNSFSTALVTRVAFIPRRIGYDRDGRGVLLTHRLAAPKRPDGRWAVVSAVEYYWRAGEALLEAAGIADAVGGERRLSLGVTEAQEQAAAQALRAVGIEPGAAYAVINPGGNNPAKRWPAERFGAVAAHIARTRGWPVVVSGAPGEAEVIDAVVRAAGSGGAGGAGGAGGGSAAVRAMVGAPGGLGAVKGVVRGARLLVTNDTGPRHIAAAFGVPTVTLFGPTDPRWTTLPTWPGCGARVDVVADPDLPAELVADDEPERCRIDRIAVERVVAAVDRVVGGPNGANGADGADRRG